MKPIRIIPVFLLLLCLIQAKAQPKPGDIFRDYVWVTPENTQKFLRVIGDGDYRSPVHKTNELSKELIKNGWITIDEKVDLDKAIKAEIQIEMLLSHDATTGLAVKLNNNKTWHYFRMPDAIPEPKATYLQHNYPTISIPLDEIVESNANKLRFRVDSLQRFGMPQNIIYGVRLRIYYNKNKKHSKAEIKGIAQNRILAQNQSLELTKVKGKISNVQFVGLYRDVNFEGDGISRQWHYTYYRGKMRNNIGTSKTSPYKIVWNTSWLPNQEKEIQLSAVVSNEKGVSHFLPSVKNVKLQRDYSVELSMPYDIPQRWATREGDLEQKNLIIGKPKEAEAFQLVFVSWSPGYLNGIYINDWLVPTFEDCNYCYGVHRIEVDKTHFLKQGENIVKTGGTPLINGKMVHGAEIQFPGMMLLVKYPKRAVTITEENYKNHTHFKVETQGGTYFIEKQSGGCSSLIDTEGRDWVDFKKTGHDGPTLSSDSDYRGIPNLVWQAPGDGIGHPGFDKCETTKISDNELLVKSKDNKWEYRWVFHAQYAELVVDKTDDSRKYWFLYEGPVAEKFAPSNHFWGNNIDGLRTDIPGIFGSPASGNWKWAFFGDKTINTTLFVAQDKNDNLNDFFAYMGNKQNQGNLSPDGMNVFGFGRAVKTAPLLKGKNRFFIGFFPQQVFSNTAVKQLHMYINQITN